jgi:hypothetical protein
MSPEFLSIFRGRLHRNNRPKLSKVSEIRYYQCKNMCLISTVMFVTFYVGTSSIRTTLKNLENVQI